MHLTIGQLDHAKSVLRWHYGLSHLPADDLVYLEIASLRRKCGDFDDISSRIAASLETGRHPIDLDGTAADLAD
jgi:hypothetical protein